MRFRCSDSTTPERQAPVLVSGVCLLVVQVHQVAYNPADAADLADSAVPQAVVVVTAVLPDSEVPLDEVAANVQQIGADRVAHGKALNISEALSRMVGSVNVNDTQGNPFQPDINFRGFTASPVLGTPQGISVFVDGVRVNESFGDAVNWDLIPSAAIARIEVIPGSDPVFGLNTLGGALTVTTKRGFEFPGTVIDAYGGSFGRRALELETGGHGERLDYFLTGNIFNENGWGEHNPSEVRQVFGRTGYRDGKNDLSLSVLYADNRLQGNQTLPRSFLSDPFQSYSWPDIQSDTTAFVNLDASHRFSDEWTLAGNTYYRKVSTAVLNSNVNDDYDRSLPMGPGNEPTGNAIEGIDQYRPGAALQLTGRSPLAGHRNTVIAGVTYDAGTTNFRQFNQEAGASRDTSSTAPSVLGTLLHATNRYTGLYFTDTLGINKRLFLNVAGRYNRATQTLQDRLGTALNGQDTFNRFNPSVGLTFNPTPAATVYATYNEGMRVPTPVELSCADPNAPCSLPNAFSADPPLKAVVAKTLEAGARGTLFGGIKFSAAVFRTNLDDDIQFISSGGGATSAGYFHNVSQTRRQGLELGLDGHVGPVALNAHYTYLEATFQTPLILSSPDNSTAAPLSCPTCAEIQVRPGDRIPGIPRHVVKLRAEYFATRYSVAIEALGQSDLFARGDENNQDVNGPIPGYVLINLDAHYALSSAWHVFARVDNLLNRRYSTFGVLGQNVFTAPGDTFDPTGASWRIEQFRTVGVPRGAWVGVELDLGRPEEGT
jgi:iron complex outermembrane recepter protein